MSVVEFRWVDVAFVDDATRDTYLAKSKALISTSIEEYGIAMVEALAAGVPVIKQRRGAAVALLPRGTGLLLDPPLTPTGLAAAINEIDSDEFFPSVCRDAVAISATQQRTITTALASHVWP